MEEETKKKVGTVNDPTQDPNDMRTKNPQAAVRPRTREEVKEADEEDQNQDTVTMFFPTRVTLTMPGHISRTFGPGPAEVPENMADHQYLKDNGAYEFKKGQPAPEEARGRLVDPVSGIPVSREESIPGDTKELSIFDRDPSHIRADEAMMLDRNVAQENRREERENSGEDEGARESRLNKQREAAEKERRGPAKLNKDATGAVSTSEKRKDPVESADSIAKKGDKSKKEE
jgi:hypothetical protein